MILSLGGILNLILLSFVTLLVFYHFKVFIRLVSAKRISEQIKIDSESKKFTFDSAQDK